MNPTYLTHTPDETKEIGTELAAHLSGGDVICLYGDLGAGKTTFTQGITKGFNIHKRIISPTFSIIRIYECDSKSTNIKRLYHVDLYRIEGLEQLQNLGIEEIMSQSNAIIIIEWPEKLESLMPKNRIDIHMSGMENSRKITIQKIQ